MGRDHSRCALLDEEVLQPLQRRHIEVVRGFVEEQNVGVIEQQAREPETGSLATRERRDLAIDETAEAEPAKDPPERRLEVVPARVLEVMLGIGIAFERRRIAARDLLLETPQLALELTEMRGRATRVLDDRARRILEELLPQETDPGAARERDGAAVGRIETGRDAQQRGLPRPIRTDKADAVTLADPERDVLQHLALAVPARDGLDRENAHLTILRRPVRLLGAFWHRGQWNVPRPPTTVRTTARPQRGHGSPARSYIWNSRCIRPWPPRAST